MNEMPVPARYRDPAWAGRIALIAASFERLLGRGLVETQSGDVVSTLWHAEDVVVAHGNEADPLFFFGNRSALRAFECDVAQFVGMPSRLSAETPDRVERQALLDRVTAQGFIVDYAGGRITARGRRFRIEQAIVWNLIDDSGMRHGQAATFRL